MKDATLFVFYTLHTSERWTYGTFPKGWMWIGGGSTASIGSTPLQYEREEQFSGPKDTVDTMRKYLDRYFTNLQKKGVVRFYKIRRHYIP